MADDLTFDHYESLAEMKPKLAALMQQALEYLKATKANHVAFVFAAMEADEKDEPIRVQVWVGGSSLHVNYLLDGARKRHQQMLGGDVLD